MVVASSSFAKVGNQESPAQKPRMISWRGCILEHELLAKSNQLPGGTILVPHQLDGRWQGKLAGLTPCN